MRHSALLPAVTLVFCAAACGGASTVANPPANQAPPGDPRIASALSAAPAVITTNATIKGYPVAAGEPYPVLRAGSGAWTCFPDDPRTPGPDPACYDRNAMLWLDAFYAGTVPHLPAPGIVYKMQGGSDPSMDDPFATAPPAGGQYVTTPPYLVVIPAGDPRTLTADAVPPGSHEAVMWAGTAYAHLHVPLP